MDKGVINHARTEQKNNNCRGFDVSNPRIFFLSLEGGGKRWG